jgi:calcium/calmodulin-dependent protein kinase (CaM kinase) II
MNPKESQVSSDPVAAELLALNRRLLEAIVTADWKTYEELCDPSLSCFEPEARSQLVEGMDFHHFYFQLGGTSGSNNTTMCAPHIRIMGEVAVVSYVRLVQRVDSSGVPSTSRSEETRVWQKQAGGWRHVHFHRSAGG